MTLPLVIFDMPDGSPRSLAASPDARILVADGAGGERPETDAELVARIAARDVPATAANIRYVDPANWTPPMPALLKAAGVDAERDRRLSAGYVDATTGKTWQCRAEDLPRWDGIAASAGLNVLRGGAFAAKTYDLIAADNSTLTLAASDASALLEGRVMAWVSATILYARTLKNQILAGQAPDITTGWP